MADKLMMFGREVESPVSVRPSYATEIGLIGAKVYSRRDHWNAKASMFNSDNCIAVAMGFDTKELARDWLESEVRRVLRETFELMGATFAVVDPGTPRETVHEMLFVDETTARNMVPR